MYVIKVMRLLLVQVKKGHYLKMHTSAQDGCQTTLYLPCTKSH